MARPWVACSKCGPASWVFADRNIQHCTKCGGKFPKQQPSLFGLSHWPRLEPPWKMEKGKGKATKGGKGAGGKSWGAQPPAGDQTPRQLLAPEMVEKVRALLADSKEAELKDLLMPIFPAKAEVEVVSVGTVGQKLEKARATLGKAKKKLEKNQSEVVRLKEALAKAEGQVLEAEAEVHDAEEVHAKALEEYSCAAGGKGVGEAPEAPGVAGMDKADIEVELAKLSSRRLQLEQALRKAEPDEGEGGAQRHKVRRMQDEAAELQRQAERAKREADAKQQQAERAVAAAASAASAEGEGDEGMGECP